MGVFSFLKNVGERVFDQIEEQREHRPIPQLEKLSVFKEGLQRQKINLLQRIMDSSGVAVKNLSIAMQGTTVVVSGEVNAQADRERFILTLGNVAGVSAVDDRIMVNASTPKPKAVFYEVKKGDSLSKIANLYYGDPMKYNHIFQANQPMLTNPDRIYPGQKLRIPPFDH